MIRLTRDRGAADALALVLIAPASIGLALLVVFLGRGVEGRAITQSAAESAAQAAALERSPHEALAAATAVVDAMLTNPDACSDPQVEIDTSDFRPGGSVAVTVRCTPSGRSVEIVEPSDRSYATRAVARIDPFRAAEGP